MHAATITIYTLSDKEGNIFYVGYTTQTIEKRLAQHLADARLKYNGGKKKNDRIALLNFEIVATVIDMANFKDEHWDRLLRKARKLEKEWIQKFQSLGHDLTNGRNKKPEQFNWIGKSVRSTTDYKIESEAKVKA